MTVLQESCAARTGGKPQGWPVEVELILSAIETGQHVKVNRRTARRVPYRVKGWLKLFSDGADSEAKVIYTRDVHSRGLGFLTPHRLPLGHGGLIEVTDRSGQPVSIHCTLLRCREAAPGWYEGSVYFNREQPQLMP